MFTHEVGARCSVSSLDLLNVLLDQISTCSMVLVVSDRPRIVGLLVVMDFFYLLLEPKLFKDLKVEPIVISWDQRGTFMPGLCDPPFIPDLQMPETSCSTPFWSKQLRAWGVF